ncbi:hypothetical protein [Streptomyces griseus]|uniref:hypothetical protein n=1 Tax=Streptomyces griseus TaxID=1911 RepID=UPI00056AA847|nr:hypothetical protein [Streptomyces griseus]
MTPASTARSLPRSRAWLRVLVLLLAVVVPGAHAEAHPAPVGAVAGESVEYDALDTVLRPPAHHAHRPAAPLRPTPLPAPRPGDPAVPPLPAPPGPPYSPHTLRSVVLRC